jgi:hypothetical protein
MQSDISDLRSTIVPKSDQLNADQLIAGPMTIRVSAVKAGGTEEQPITIHYENDGGRPYKPCKTMRKLLVFAWGADGRDWVGRGMTLYNDPSVKFGGAEVGGIRISHLSHIDREIRVSLTSTKGKKALHSVKPLSTAPESTDKQAAMLAEFEQIAREYGLQAFIDAWNATPKPSRPPTTERDRIAAIATQRDQQQQEKT